MAHPVAYYRSKQFEEMIPFSQQSWNTVNAVNTVDFIFLESLLIRSFTLWRCMLFTLQQSAAY